MNASRFAVSVRAACSGLAGESAESVEPGFSSVAIDKGPLNSGG
jgi:hypothetical protein